jgi:DNA-binding CsgD family transcriptional regulator
MAIGRLHLTPQQERIVVMRLERRRREDIARALGISPDTVRFHLDAAREANGCESEVELLLAADRERRP